MGQSGAVFRSNPPLKVRIAAHNSPTRTGGIDQDPVEDRDCFRKQVFFKTIPGQALNDVESQSSGVFHQGLYLIRMKVDGQNISLIIHQLGQMTGLSSGSGTKIQDPLPGSGIQNRGNDLGGLILDLEKTLLM